MKILSWKEFPEAIIFLEKINTFLLSLNNKVKSIYIKRVIELLEELRKKGEEK